MRAHAVLACEPVEHRAERRSVRLQLGLGRGVRCARAAVHRRVDVCRERQHARTAVCRRVAPRGDAGSRSRNRRASYSWACARSRASPRASPRGLPVTAATPHRRSAAHTARAPMHTEIGHLPLDLRDRVRAIDRHLVRVRGVVAGLAREVACREHAVRALAAREPAPEQLCRRARRVRAATPSGRPSRAPLRGHLAGLNASKPSDV